MTSIPRNTAAPDAAATRGPGRPALRLTLRARLVLLVVAGGLTLLVERDVHKQIAVLDVLALSPTLLLFEESGQQVSVIDTGRGMAPEIAAQLFKPFITSKKDGMGIGLSISQTIIAAHGGRLWSEPNPDGGAVFYFTLPEQTEDPA